MWSAWPISRLLLALPKPACAGRRVLITTDSGPRHFAAAFNTPVITLFGPTHIAWTRTYHPHAWHILHKVPCGPCQRPVCPEGHHRCMRDLSPESVFRAACARSRRRNIIVMPNQIFRRSKAWQSGLLTGATGFVGRHVLECSQGGAAAGCRSAMTGCSCSVAAVRTHGRATDFVAADLTDANKLPRAIEQIKPDFVIHTAGRTPPAPDEELYRGEFLGHDSPVEPPFVRHEDLRGSSCRGRQPS